MAACDPLLRIQDELSPAQRLGGHLAEHAFCRIDLGRTACHLLAHAPLVGGDAPLHLQPKQRRGGWGGEHAGVNDGGKRGGVGRQSGELRGVGDRQHRS